MRDSTHHPKMLRILLTALLPVLFVAGCHGGLGWDRMDAPLGRQSQADVYQPQQPMNP